MTRKKGTKGKGLAIKSSIIKNGRGPVLGVSGKRLNGNRFPNVLMTTQILAGKREGKKPRGTNVAWHV